jgi:uncharacterized membrane protein
MRTWSFLAVGLLAAIYLLTSVLIASHRLFWYDEILTVTISRLPDLATIWKALTHASDGQPPTYYVLVRMFLQLPVSPEVGARLPSALAMVAGMLITFDCARRLSDGVYGLIAFSVLSSSTLSYYGYEARPYALYFMFASLALWLWVHTSDASKLSSILFGVVIFLAVAAHYYAVLCLVPYAAWEVCNWRTRRAASGKLIAGCLGVLCAAAIFSRDILALGQATRGFWGRPVFHSLAGILNDFFPYGLFPLAAIMTWVALVGPREKGAVSSRMQPYEQLGWLFSLIPLAGFMLAKLGTGAFYYRYYIAILPGIAVAFSCLLWRQFRGAPWMSIAILVLFATLGLGIQFALVRYPDLVLPPSAKNEPERLNAMLRLEGKMPITAKAFIVLRGNDLLSIEAPYYSKHPEKYVFLPSDNPITRGVMNLAHYSPRRIWTLDDLKAQARETTLIYPTRETVDALAQAGYKVISRYDEGLEVVSVE